MPNSHQFNDCRPTATANSRVCQMLQDFGATEGDEFEILGTGDKITFTSTSDTDDTYTSTSAGTVVPPSPPASKVVLSVVVEENHNDNHNHNNKPRLDPDGWYISASYNSHGPSPTASAPSTRGNSSQSTSSIGTAAAAATLAAAAAVGRRYYAEKVTKKKNSNNKKKIRHHQQVVVVEDVSDDETGGGHESDISSLFTDNTTTTTAATNTNTNASTSVKNTREAKAAVSRTTSMKATTTTSRPRRCIGRTVSAEEEEEHEEDDGDIDIMCPALANEEEEGDTGVSMATIQPEHSFREEEDTGGVSMMILPPTQEVVVHSNTPSTIAAITLPITTTIANISSSSTAVMTRKDSVEGAVDYAARLCQVKDAIHAQMAASGVQIDEASIIQMAERRILAQEQLDEKQSEEARRYMFEHHRETRRFTFEDHQRSMNREQKDRIHEESGVRKDRCHAESIKYQQQDKDWLAKLTAARSRTEETLYKVFFRASVVVITVQVVLRAGLYCYYVYEGGISGLFTLAIDQVFSECTATAASSPAQQSSGLFSSLLGHYAYYVPSLPSMSSMQTGFCYFRTLFIPIGLCTMLTLITYLFRVPFVRDLILCVVLVYLTLSHEKEILVELAVYIASMSLGSLIALVQIRKNHGLFKIKFLEKANNAGENPSSAELNKVLNWFEESSVGLTDAAYTWVAVLVILMLYQQVLEWPLPTMW